MSCHTQAFALDVAEDKELMEESPLHLHVETTDYAESSRQEAAEEIIIVEGSITVSL